MMLMFFVAAWDWAFGIVNQHLTYAVVTAGLEHRPRPRDVDLEGRDRRPPGGADDGLRGQVEDGVHVVVAEGPVHRVGVRAVAVKSRVVAG